MADLLPIMQRSLALVQHAQRWKRCWHECSDGCITDQRSWLMTALLRRTPAQGTGHAERSPHRYGCLAGDCTEELLTLRASFAERTADAGGAPSPQGAALPQGAAGGERGPRALLDGHRPAAGHSCGPAGMRGRGLVL